MDGLCFALAGVDWLQNIPMVALEFLLFTGAGSETSRCSIRVLFSHLKFDGLR